MVDRIFDMRQSPLYVLNRSCQMTKAIVKIEANSVALRAAS